MDAVPSLCASGTVGIAPLGFAFARPRTSTNVRPASGKRKVLERRTSEGVRGSLTALNTPSRPTVVTHSLSAPAAQIPLRFSSLRRPNSAFFQHDIPETRAIKGGDEGTPESTEWRSSLLLPDQESGQMHDPISSNVSGPGTSKPTWLRRISTIASSRDASPTSTPRPGTPSLSSFNGSNAPMLPSSPYSTPTLPRNKLVKRSTSQHLLQSDPTGPSFSSPQVPSLRRPATSHQRSATIRQARSGADNEPIHDMFRQSHDTERNTFGRSSGQFRSSYEIESKHIRKSSEGSSRAWRPFFQSRSFKPIKEGSKARNSASSSNPNSTGSAFINVIPTSSGRPQEDELPTLLKATSITSPPVHDPSKDIGPYLYSTESLAFNPRTHRGAFSSPIESHDEPAFEVDEESKPRSSFSISDIFSSSPSSWKIPRSGSLRKKKGKNNPPSSRRVTSAPQSSTVRRPPPNSSRNSTPQSQASDNSLGAALDRRHKSNFSLNQHRARSPSSPLPPLARLSAFEIDLPGSAPSYPTSPQSNQAPSPSSQSNPFPNLAASASGLNVVRTKPHRTSRVPSDRASTLIGSDTENSRILATEGEETDFQSETVYDSVRTGTTGSSNSGNRGPRLDKVFNETTDLELRKDNLVVLQDLLASGSFAKPRLEKDYIAEEDESVRTPVPAPRSYEDDFPTPVGGAQKGSSSPGFVSSSPPSFSRTNAPYGGDQMMVDALEIEEWDFEGVVEDQWDLTKGTKPHAKKFESSPFAHDQQDVIMSDGPHDHENRPRSNIFEWSERPNTEDPSRTSSPRPKTVHGKQLTEGRGSRSTGRRGPSALHLRSQSVPVPQDGPPHRGYSNASKHSWLLGNKGASEDWDNDFDFEEPPQRAVLTPVGSNTPRAGDSSGMLVPRAILERQASVHGQFGQVKELTQLVEELKRLRQQATGQGIVYGQSAELWKEAEGIINLATLDDEDREFLPPQSPNSPNNEFDPFEDDSPAGRRRRRSVLLTSQDEAPRTSQQPSPAGSKLTTPPSGRPRKESAAKAKSVLETISHNRNDFETPFDHSKTVQKKLPFDTTSLRDLVTRAGVVTRALKEIVRKAEPPDSPHTPVPDTGQRPDPPDPPFSQIFQHPSSPTSQHNKSPKFMSPTNNAYRGGSISGNDNDINGHMKMMTVV